MRFVFSQMMIFAFVFLLLFSLMRLVMSLEFLGIPLMQENLKDTIKLFLLGAVSDLRLISAAFLPLLAVMILSIFNPLWINTLKKWGGGQNLSLNRFYFYLSSIFIAFLAFGFISFCFLNFYYYELYQTNIDVFIFGLKDDNTQAILEIAFKDYPFITLCLIAIIFSAFCFWLNKKILNLNLPSFHLKLPIVLVLLLVFLTLYALALRGPFRHVAMNVETYRFSNLENFNALVLNPLMSFAFAFKNYQKETLNLQAADKEKLKSLEEKLFPLFATNPKNDFALTNKPHIMVNLMESFGTQMLLFQQKGFNLLGELQTHFESDFVWTRFLPFENGTAPSLFGLFLKSPIVLSKSQYKKHYLPLSPIETYKEQGYRVIYLTSGNRSWFDMGSYMQTQGVDEVIDEILLLEEYPNAKKTHFTYGVGDEFMYQKALEILQTAQKPTLILALSISNHPPFHEMPMHFSKEQIPSELLNKFSQRASLNVNAYTYANNEFGKFLSKIKQGALKDKVIIAATGDHRVRDLKIDFDTEKAFGFSVPFYLYVPKPYQKDIVYDKTRVGSHKDIFPTLYALTLSEVKTLNLGGRNLLGKIESQKLEFAYNRSVWIDEKGIYPNTSMLGYSFVNTETLLNSNESFELDTWRLEFHKLYEELLDTQLRYRLINLQNP